MNSITIKMSATPSEPTAGALPTSVQFSPAGVINGTDGANVTFEIESSLLAYINKKDINDKNIYVVTFTWQGSVNTLTDGTSLTNTIGTHDDTYILDVCLASSDQGCENGTSSSGEIVVESAV